MKIIVCGAGTVGANIVEYLVHGDNDIVVIDADCKRLENLSSHCEILPVFGNAAYPEVLDRAGAADADLLLAVTSSDEVNMTICQVAHTIFNIKKKVARIDAPEFLDAAWNVLYNDKNMPIDLIISPDLEVAKSIEQILKISGATDVVPFAAGALLLLAFRCAEDCPLVNSSVADLERHNQNLAFSMVSIVRNDKAFIPTKDENFEPGDLIYLMADKKHLHEVMELFGIKDKNGKKIVIYGGNNVSMQLAKILEEDERVSNCKIIEPNLCKAKELANLLTDTVVINGEMICDAVLKDSGMEDADACVAVTYDDKENILAALLAEKDKIPENIVVVNSSDYNTLVDIIADTALVDRASVTFSSLLKVLRKPRLEDAYALGRGIGEIWQFKIGENSPVLDEKIADLGLPSNAKICVILRGEEVFYPKLYDKLQKDDKVLLYTDADSVKKTEKIFAD